MVLQGWWPLFRITLATLANRDTLLVTALLILYGAGQTLFDQGVNLFAIRQLGWGEGIWSGFTSLLAAGVLLAMPGWWHSERFHIVWHLAVGIPSTLFYLSFLVLAMRVSTAEVAATSFAVLAAIYSFGLILGGPLLALVDAGYGLSGLFLA